MEAVFKCAFKIRLYNVFKEVIFVLKRLHNPR